MSERATCATCRWWVYPKVPLGGFGNNVAAYSAQGTLPRCQRFPRHEFTMGNHTCGEHKPKEEV